MHLTELGFRRKPLVYFLLACILLGGVLSFRSISKLEDPEIVVMMARVVTLYPGAPAHQVELEVTDILEKELATLSDIQQIQSRSGDNLSMITVELKMTVPQQEIQQRWEFLRRKVEAALPLLPDGVRPPMVIDDFGDVYGMFYAMTAGGYSYREMEKYARYVKREMLDIEGVNRVHLFGHQQPVTDIVVSRETMDRMGVFPVQIFSAITAANELVYPGVLEAGDRIVRLEAGERIRGPEDLEGLPIKGIRGELFRLGDIASIETGYATPLRNTLFLNNQEAMAIAVSMESGENIIGVGKRVEARMQEIRKALPAGIRFEKVFFQPDKVGEAIGGFMGNLAASVGIVVLVLMAAMGLRSGLIIGAALALTVLATFPVLLATGGTLQRISLGAFIVAMGMLVDNAIVVIDGIMGDMYRGTDRQVALTRTAKRTAWPLLGATLIAISAFLPVFLSKDTAGTYARDLFVVLCISLLISWILALTQVPLFAGKWLRVSRGAESSRRFVRRMNHGIRDVLSFLIGHKLATIAGATLLLAAAALQVRHIQNAFFPDLKYEQVYIEYLLPDGTSPDRVNADLRAITDHLLSLDEVNMVVSSQGMSPARYCLVRAIGEASDNYGELIVDFDDYRTMVRMKPTLEAYFHDHFPDAYVRIRNYNLSVKSSHTVEVAFRGPDPAVLRSLGEQAKEVMRRDPLTDKLTITDDWHPMGHSLRARYERDLAARAGISRSDIGNALLAATSGIPLGRYHDGQTAVTLRFRTREGDGSPIERLEDIPVWSMLPDPGRLEEADLAGLLYGSTSVEDLTGTLVRPLPLSAVTRGMEHGWTEPVVRRVNGQRALQAQCDPAEGYSPAQVRRSIKKDIEAIALPQGYTQEWVGEYELQHLALKNIFGYLPLAGMLILLILVLLFNDLKKPAIILLCIPLTGIGIVPALVMTGSPFTFMAIVGAIGLSGMLIKNAVVLLGEIGDQISQGNPRYDALVDATLLRTRPVVLASLTTMLGMLPLLADPMYQSMAVTIISGLLAGTLVTLIFVPILYAAFFRISGRETALLAGTGAGQELHKPT